MNRVLLALFALTVVSLPCARPSWAKTTVCAGPVTVDGNDVSYWQGTINWAGLKAAGRKFVIMRVAHALAFDTKFDFNWKSCHDQGLHCGVYLYFEPNVDPIAQANLLLNKMGPLGPGDLPPVADVESTGGGMTPTAIAAAVKKFIDHVEAKVGRKPMIYSGGYFWEDNVKSTAFVDYPLWHPQYCTNCCPNIANPWKKWYFWQYSSTGKVGGITGNVDMNYWNGSLTALGDWAVKSSMPPPTCTLHCEGATLVQANCSKSTCGADTGCVVDDLGGRCVSKYCPAKGDKQVCVPSTGNALVGTCKNGALATGDCGKYGAFCSTAAAVQAKCVSAFCAASPTEKPAAKDVCLPDGKRYACTSAGDISEKPCAAKSVCKMQNGAALCEAVTCDPHCEGAVLVVGNCSKTDCGALAEPQKGSCVADSLGARCVSAYCPAKGSATACTKDGDGVVNCSDGSAVASICLAGEQVCAAKAIGGAACADKVCVPIANLPPLAGQTCLPGNTILTCTAKGLATLQTCPAGQGCVPGAAIAQCEALKPPDADAGTADSGPTDTGQADAGSAPDADNPVDDSTIATDAGSEPDQASADIATNPKDVQLVQDTKSQAADSTTASPDTAENVVDLDASGGAGIGAEGGSETSTGVANAAPQQGGLCSARSSSTGNGWVLVFLALASAGCVRRRRAIVIAD